ncbi:MAG: membrane dipeptidase [Bacilli bacterium]|nr:membrane dipeptidase [Bacilli bacterium]
MYDMHYDLLTAIYMAKLNNDFEGIKKWISYYNSNNVTGVVANMCFMSKKEMQEEYHSNYYKENISVLRMFKESVDLVNEFMNKDIDILFGIEGCDYLNKDELKPLYDIGLRAIAPVWNEPNKYASGIRDDYGLTLEGALLLEEAITLGIAIDLSHCNEKTFSDIIEFIKDYRDEGINPIVYASHSNSRRLCDRERNLTDNQLIKLKEVDGYVGVMSNRNFVIKGALENNIDIELLKDAYIQHLIHIGNIIGFDHLMISTDDIKFSLGDIDYQKLPIYNYESIAKDLRKDLSKYFNEEAVEDIMINNANKILKKVKGGNYERKSRNVM